MASTLRRMLLLGLFVAGTACAQSSLKLVVDAGNGHGRVRNTFVYGDCGGHDLSPAMHWHGAPEGTRSFALSVFDPDASNGKGWWHWIVIDLPANVHGLAMDATLPAPARSLRNDFGHLRYDGPCPPAGDLPHHYVFTIYALDVASLKLGANASATQFQSALSGHVRARADAVFTYAR
ncbi:YbhB/YbcL family Raf kinase inhibitor-like protein [Oleiagrimonas sp.]|uniref:YbhB/YbcL family Raf kinase inhibitor-like protein n=1 Tax=Oleiagrimonas sp. TaxID=2010330 RepID=UPI00262103B6|nr:YbhB/YbcL family Raf kinase inhibitor-like protein [Oleiagrimonas sp.]MDA3914194.1 YbhB/YbcL family Raf kinase inhibitor-like protein [Oleiagrimonas sp.]